MKSAAFYIWSKPLAVLKTRILYPWLNTMFLFAFVGLACGRHGINSAFDMDTDSDLPSGGGSGMPRGPCPNCSARLFKVSVQDLHAGTMKRNKVGR